MRSTRGIVATLLAGGICRQFARVLRAWSLATAMVLAAIAGWPVGALAQDAGLYQHQQQQYDELIRQQLVRSEQAVPERLGVDWGGWFNFSNATFQDAAHELNSYQLYDLYLWGRAMVDQSHEFYVRGRFDVLDFEGEDPPFGHSHDSKAQVDRLFYAFDLRKATLAKEKQNLPYDVFTTVGRQYVQFGTGLALSMPMDAVIIGGELANVEVKGLAGQSIKSTLNIDQSPQVATHEERDFYGVQVTYKGLPDHQPFAYYIWQQDGTQDHPEDPNQEFNYDSQYLGIGSTGRPAPDLRNLYYQTELVWEHGRDFGFGATEHQDPICALAYDLNLNYVFQSHRRPEVSFEYLFASGDHNRLGSPTNTIGGNRPGTEDNGFNGFGFRNTGLALATPISNLHMFRVGGDFRPMPDNKCLENFVLGSDFFYFLKADSEGAGADPGSGQDDLNLGPEVDVYFNWRLTSDLLWTVRYGVFVPGDAYSNGQPRNCRNFLFTGLTFSF